MAKELPNECGLVVQLYFSRQLGLVFGSLLAIVSSSTAILNMEAAATSSLADLFVIRRWFGMGSDLNFLINTASLKGH